MYSSISDRHSLREQNNFFWNSKIGWSPSDEWLSCATGGQCLPVSSFQEQKKALWTKAIGSSSVKNHVLRIDRRRFAIHRLEAFKLKVAENHFIDALVPSEIDGSRKLQFESSNSSNWSFNFLVLHSRFPITLESKVWMITFDCSGDPAESEVWNSNKMSINPKFWINLNWWPCSSLLGKRESEK